MSEVFPIPEEAIEAAARGLADHYTDVSFAAGEGEVYSEHDTRDDARAAVEASAPLILAAELERLAAEIDSAPVELADLMGRGLQYNAGKGFVTGQLRRRAYVLRGEGQTDA